jgi:uncharacterized protein
MGQDANSRSPRGRSAADGATVRAECIVAVFSKLPRPGAAKTRLIPRLGADGAAEVHRDLLRRTLSTASSSAVGPVELWCSPSADDPFFRGLAFEHGATLHTQGPGDLGQRMAAAFRSLLGRAATAVLIGSDCPALCAEDLRAARAALASDAPAVVGPCEDGGYYLIGLAREAPALFSGIEWGADQVLARTRQKLLASGWNWRELAMRWDVDRPEDFDRWLADPAAR